jgi:hypothetical protein
VSPEPDKPETDGAGLADAEARSAELREELAITDERRAEEEEAKAEAHVAAAVKDESKKERKRREAEEARRAAAAEAEAARQRAEEARGFPGPAPSPVADVADESDRPELLVAAAFAGAFVFARILKRITG